MAARTYLDVSRLLSAGYRRTPSGIERVELAYAQHLAQHEATQFVAFFLQRLHVLPRGLVLSYIAALEAKWRNATQANKTATLARMAMSYALLPALALSVLPRRNGSAIYLNISHHNLTAPRAIAAFKTRMAAKALFFVHDLIPITHPEYVRPGHAEKHMRRMQTVADLADMLLVNSADTQAAFTRHFAGVWQNPIHVVHLGVPPAPPPAPAPAAEPYFLMLATIEPRKNHLLLLHLWRQFTEAGGQTPRLVIIGRQGWENEMVLDLLERCAAIKPFVEWRNRLGDAELAQLLSGARALLLPSFAEGFGLPVAEALQAGTPVICSNIAALREIGGDVPEYLNPLDGPAWAEAILDYAQPYSPRRVAQCERLRHWQAPGWPEHFRQLEALIAAMR